MNTPKLPEREAFEAWMRGDATLSLEKDGHGYVDMTVELMWHAWKSRAAIEAQGVPDDLCDDDLSELADSANQEALSFGLNHDVFLRYFKTVRNRALASAPQAPQGEQHPDDAAVDRFAAAMKDKLAIARQKGRGGWETCSAEDLGRMLREHVNKGDPRDVANFCMFLWSLGYGIAPQANRTHVLVPLRMTRAMQDVVGEEDWSWADLLAAAEAVTKEEHAIAEQTEPVTPKASVVQQESEVRIHTAVTGCDDCPACVYETACRYSCEKAGYRKFDADGEAASCPDWCPLPLAHPAQQSKPPEWYAIWIRNNYQDYPNIQSLCDALIAAANAPMEE